jgi:aspartate kinase
MRVYKFGGGVLKDAAAVKKIPDLILQAHNRLLIVVSAFGKTTGAFESLLSSYYFSGGFCPDLLDKIESEHLSVIKELFPEGNEELNQIISGLIEETRALFKQGLSADKYFEYDRIVPVGELLSVNIINAFLNRSGIKTAFADARDYLITDSGFGDAKILWEETKKKIKQDALFAETDIVITQGFTGRDITGHITTLGREGSDYTAAVYAYCLNADEIIFWKNVSGILNADPQENEDARLLSKLSYKEVVEQTFYGAKILHPKTIKPLQNKKIPVQVRPFDNPDFPGTRISDIPPDAKDFYPPMPVYIVKKDQILFSVSALDFSFIAEDSLSRIFSLLAKYRLKVSVMQNSAISFTFSVGNVKERIPLFTDELRRHYSVRYNDNLSLITIRHYTDEAIEKYLSGKDILLQQISRYTARFVVQNGSGASVFRYDFVGQNLSNFEN